jgi:stage V sporulation protein D (sporulation-specific penicillin-binding protein)
VIQHFLEKQLETAVAEENVKERATGIVMDVNTGEILAMAVKKRL